MIRMKKTHILFLFVVVLIIVGCARYEDVNQYEREQLFLELWEAKTVDECHSIMNRIVELGPACQTSIRNITECAYPSSWYQDMMISCISTIAVKQNNQQLCEDEEVVKNLCNRWPEVVKEERQAVPKTGADIESSTPAQKSESMIFVCSENAKVTCLFSFISKANPNTDIEIDCDSYEQKQRDECYWALAAGLNNQELCNKISYGYGVAQCHHYFAFREHDISLCERGHKDKWEECMQAFEILENKDYNVCENIDNFYGSSSEAICRVGFAIYNQDSSICSYYRKDGWFVNKMCERYT